jgi:cysteine desulfuration protein SufE
MSQNQDLPAKLQDIANEFAEVPDSDRLQLLLEFSQSLPELPERYAEHPELLEPVPECQSPIFLVTEVEDDIVNLFFSAPQEAPTTRGFASILHEGLNGENVETVLSTPSDVAMRLSMTDQVSPLRLNGMSGMLARIQRQVKEATA